MIACVEEIAYRMGFITVDQLGKLVGEMRSNSYGQYLLRLVDKDPLEPWL